MATPGEFLYRHICFNCHGPKADGKGLQADLLGTASEGEVRPANFREGLFGPLSNPGANLMNEFAAAGSDVVPWASRYMAWMALGGTLQRIPQDVIRLVQATKVFGESRRGLARLPGADQVTGNMLNLAKGLCSVLLPEPTFDGYAPAFFFDHYKSFRLGGSVDAYPPFNAKEAPFIGTNGDKGMWLDICSRFSPAVVRVYRIVAAGGTTRDINLEAMYYADGYGTALVLDQEGHTQMGIDITKNYYPACFDPPSDPADKAWFASLQAGNALSFKALNMPPCPVGLVGDPNKLFWDARIDTADRIRANINQWEFRGAIAAGMSVFSYLHDGGAQSRLPPYYNECPAVP